VGRRIAAATEPSLVEWFRAQLDEDARVARAASDPNCYFDLLGGSNAEEAFLREFDPARVLREVEAKRALIGKLDGDPFDALGAEGAYELLVLQHLALPYADRHGYREEWRP
jgi:hypothetical protein